LVGSSSSKSCGSAQGDPLRAAAGERIDAGIAIQRQARNGLFDPRTEAPAVVGLKLRLQFVHAIHVRRVAGADFMGHLVVFGEHAGHVAQPRRDGFEHRVVAGEFRLLRHIGDREAGLAPDLAIVERTKARQRFQQAGFAAAVAADEADAFAGIDLHRGVVQQGDMAVGEAGAIEGDDGHGNEAGKGR
jgi:hypothetical protein